MCHDFIGRTLKTLKKVDIFAQPVQLLIKQERGHKTLFGAGLTLGLISLFTYFLIFNLYNLSLRKDPSSFTTQIYHTSPDYYLYDQSNFTLTFSFELSNYITYIDESIYVVDAILGKKTTKMLEGKLVEEWSEKELPLIACSSDLIRQNTLKDYYSHLDLPANYCINWDKIDKIELQGTFGARDYSYILIKFKMCTQATKKSKECRPKDEIIKILERNYFSMQMSSLVVDVKDPEQPFTSVGQDIYTTISSKILKEISLYLQPVTILSDFGLITKSYIEQNSLKYNGFTEMIDVNESDLIMNVDIRLDQTEQQYYRTYHKIQTIFGELGGLWQVFFTLVFIIQKLISLLSYYIRILNSLFQFETHEKFVNKQNDEDGVSEDKFKIQMSSTRRALVVENMSGTKALERLHSIKVKKQKLDKLERCKEYPDYNQETKLQLSKAISFSIKQYFQCIAKKLRMRWTDYLYFIKCFQQSKNCKSLQIEYSVKKVIKQMDILYIMKKLQEIDKLKMILLTEPQIKVFDYLQKPKIPVNPQSELKNQPQFYFSILRPIKSDYQRAVDAQVAFKDLVQNIDNSINVKLINSIDQTIVELLKLRKRTDFTSIEDICISEQCEDKNQVLYFDTKKNKNINCKC